MSAIDYLQKLGITNLELSGPIELTGVGEQNPLVNTARTIFDYH